MTAALECGDLAPNFMLPNCKGELARFYDRFAGNAVVLCICQSASVAEVEGKLRGLAGQLDQIYAAEGRIVVVTQDNHAANARFISSSGLDLDILSDPAGAITAGYCGKPATEEPETGRTPRGGNGLSIFVIDSNQRIAAAFHGGADYIGQVFDGLKSLQDRWEPQKCLRHAPILLLPDILSPDLCQQLIVEWEREHYEGVITLGTGLRDDADDLVVASSVKRRRDHRLGNDANAWLSGIAGRRVVPMLDKVFQFQVGSMQHYRVVAYAAERGDFFATHRDNDTPTTEDRRFAMSINLNDDYEGGAMRFPEFSNELHRPPMGGGLIFSCSLLHEALPVSRGTRFVALTFFFSARATRQPLPKRLPGLGG